MKMLMHGQEIMLSSKWCSGEASSYELCLHADNNICVPVPSMSLFLFIYSFISINLFILLLLNKNEQA